MSIPNNTSMKRRPRHPGEMLREDFLSDCDLTASSLSEATGISRRSVDELLRERRSVTPEMALRLARLFGNLPEFWIKAQRAVDLWDASHPLPTQDDYKLVESTQSVAVLISMPVINADEAEIEFNPTRSTQATQREVILS